MFAFLHTPKLVKSVLSHVHHFDDAGTPLAIRNLLAKRFAESGQDSESARADGDTISFLIEKSAVAETFQGRGGYPDRLLNQATAIGEWHRVLQLLGGVDFLSSE